MTVPEKELAALSEEQRALFELMLAAEAGGTRTPVAPEEKRELRPQGPPLVLVQKGSSPQPFFFVHGGGGRILFLHALARRLPPAQTVYGIEAQGMDGKLPPLSTIEDLSAAYLGRIREIQPKGPYLIGGYCEGGLVVFDMAHRIQALGERVGLLVMLDLLRPPLRQGPGGGEPPRPSLMTPAMRIRRRFEIAQLAGLSPLSPEFPLIERVHDALSNAGATYRARPYDGRIHFIRSTKGNGEVEQKTLARLQELAVGGLVCHEIEADHIGIIQEPALGEVGKKIQEWLDEVGR